MSLNLSEIKTARDLEDAKQSFLNRVTFTSEFDCQFKIRDMIRITFSDNTMKCDDPEKIEEYVDLFNKEKSYLFGFEIDSRKLTNIKQRDLILNVPSVVIEDAEDLFYPLYIRLSYLVADVGLSDEVTKQNFHFPPVIDFVQFQSDEDCKPTVYTLSENEDYGELLLLSLDRKIKSGVNREYPLDRSSFENSVFKYQLKHSGKYSPVDGNTTVHQDMEIVESYGRYKAKIIVETDDFQHEDQAREQLSRWLIKLGRGLKIAKIIKV